MLKQCYAINGFGLQPSTRELAKVLVYVTPDDAESRYLIDELKIDEHTLASSLDPEELSRIEFEPKHVAMIFKRPKLYCAEDYFLFKTSSVGIFLFEDRLIVTLSEDTPIIEDTKVFARINCISDVILRMMSRSIYHFLDHLRVIKLLSDEVEQSIVTADSNEHLFHLFSLEKSLVYYLDAIQTNGALIERLKSSSARLGLTTDQIEFADDLLIENNQCLKASKMYSDILSSMMDARVSIVSNNLNVLMKRLTLLTVIIGAINIPASMGGMSEFTRFVVDGWNIHWSLAYVGFMAVLLLFGWATYKLLLVLNVFSNKNAVRSKRMQQIAATGIKSEKRISELQYSVPALKTLNVVTSKLQGNQGK
jgi:magnesium transporter